MKEINSDFDAVIVGGGLAGLTLALQIHQNSKAVKILVLEKRKNEAPVASHKVGESIVELGSHYLRNTLDLKKYLAAYQLPKLGFRFFYADGNNETMEQRVELGSKLLNPVPAHQIDRGLLENELIKHLNGLGIQIKMGVTVHNIDLSQEGHKIHYINENMTYSAHAKWVIDASGRRALLKRQIGLDLPIDHPVNAVWFRISEDIDIDHWSENKAWRTFFGTGKRRLATNHLIGKGYWVWIIPLVSGHTSFGIVADENHHAFEHINTFDKALLWMQKHEPVAGKVLEACKNQKIDFKVMKHFANDTSQFYSEQRWALTGDAGAFLDPFYSPGTDFIALNNTWIADLVCRDLNHEPITLRLKIYEHTHRELLRGWYSLYKDMYAIFGNTRVMIIKAVWDWSTYWGFPSLMFINNGYTNLQVLKKYAASTHSIGQKFALLNEKMQQLFLAWGHMEHQPLAAKHIDIFELNFLLRLHEDLRIDLDPSELLNKLSENLTTLEIVGSEIMRRISSAVHQTSYMFEINPYTWSIQDSEDELEEQSKSNGAIAYNESVSSDLDKAWFYTQKTLSDVR